MKEDWTEKLRQKLAGHEKTPPAGLWEDISKQMGFSTEPVRQPAVSHRWFWAVAATILLLAGFFVLYQHTDSEQPLQAEVPQQPTQQPAPQQQEETDPTVKEPTRETPVLAQVLSNKPHHEIEQEEEKQEEPKSMVQETVTQKEEMKVTVQKEEEITHTSSHKWSLGINTSSGLLAANAVEQTNAFSPMYSDHTLPSSMYNGIETHVKETDYISEHHPPIRLGLNLHYQLTPRLMLYSGVNYTYLHSKFSVRSHPTDTYIQKLHYLGVPLGLSYRVWSAIRFQLYVSGGAMLEKCVNDKPWQWSINAAVGAEYHVTRLVGFYLEPSLGYYFNDGTSLEHYYKEHPLSPSIQFGVRLHLNE